MSKLVLNRIKVILVEKNIYQKDLAKGLGWSRTYVNDVVNNRVQPSIERFFMMSSFLKVPFIELFVKDNPFEDENLMNEYIEKYKAINKQRNETRLANKQKK